MKANEAMLEKLLRSRDASFEKRKMAERAGAMRARLYAIDDELADIIELIQHVCLRSGLPLPDGIPPMRQSRMWGSALVERTLHRQVRLLQKLEKVHQAGERAGDRVSLAHLNRSRR